MRNNDRYGLTATAGRHEKNRLVTPD